jgi:predicted RNase H-like HicB family nuclease
MITRFTPVVEARRYPDGEPYYIGWFEEYEAVTAQADTEEEVLEQLKGDMYAIAEHLNLPRPYIPAPAQWERKLSFSAADVTPGTLVEMWHQRAAGARVYRTEAADRLGSPDLFENATSS